MGYIRNLASAIVYCRTPINSISSPSNLYSNELRYCLSQSLQTTVNKRFLNMSHVNETGISLNDRIYNFKSNLITRNEIVKGLHKSSSLLHKVTSIFHDNFDSLLKNHYIGDTTEPDATKYLELINHFAVDQERYYLLMQVVAQLDQQKPFIHRYNQFLTNFYQKYKCYQLINLIKDEKQRVDIVCRYLKTSSVTSVEIFLKDLLKLNLNKANLKTIINYCFNDYKVKYINIIIRELKLKDNDFLIEDIIDIDRFIYYYPCMFAQSFHLFNITHESDRIYYTEKIAKRSASDCLLNFKNFNITDKSAIQKIAALIVCNWNQSPSNNPRDFNINDVLYYIRDANINEENFRQLVDLFDLPTLNDIHEIFQVRPASTNQFLFYLKHTTKHFDRMDPVAINEYDVKVLIKHAINNPENDFDFLPNPNIGKMILNKEIPFLNSFYSQYLNNKIDFLNASEYLLSWTNIHFPLGVILNDNIKKIQEIKDIYLQKKVMLWYGLILLYQTQNWGYEKNKINDTGIINSMITVRSQTLRSSMLSDIIWLIENQNVIDEYGMFQQYPKHQKSYPLLQLIASKLADQGVDAEILKSLLRNIPDSYHKSNTNFMNLILILKKLSDESTLKSKEKTEIIKKLLPTITGTAVEKALSAKQYHRTRQEWKICFHNQVNLLSCIFSLQEANKAPGNFADLYHDVKDKIYIQLGISNSEMEAQFLEYFAHPRLKGLFLRYASELIGLNDQSIVTDLNSLVHSVIKGNFESHRKIIDTNLHMVTLKKNYPYIFQQWMEISEHEFTLEEVKDDNSTFNPKHWLNIKLTVDQHMDLEDFPGIKSTLLNLSNDSFGPLSRSDQTLLDLYHTEDKEKQIELLRTLQELILDCQFHHDIRDKILVLTQVKNKDNKGIKVCFAKTYLDFLSLGTEVSGSCQHLNHLSRYNKGLLGYILDPKNQFLIVIDIKGRILARAKLSILFSGKKPVCFLDRYYTSGGSGNYKKSILEASIKVKNLLNVPLYVSERDDWIESTQNSQLLTSLSSGISFEYSDGAHRTCKDGEYTIDNALEVIVY